MKTPVLSLIIFLQIFSINAQKIASTKLSDMEMIEKDVIILADDKMKGREIGTDEEVKAAKYIASRMRMAGLEPKGTSNYFQLFSVSPKSNPHSEKESSDSLKITGRNVIGYKDNKAELTIIIGAHYDHLGMGGEGSLDASKEKIVHNGADDNASGVALMLDLATKLSRYDYFKRFNYLFIAFSGEEKGLWGSNYFCKNPTIELERVNYMLNFDMVGRLDDSKGLAVNGVGTSSMFPKILEGGNTFDLDLIMGESGVGPSDHTSFYLQDIPVLHFFTGQHEDYHKPSDDVEKINYKGIATISTIVSNMILDTEGKVEFRKTKEEKKESPRFTVTLGVMPDYMFQGNGMRIDGVTDGKPASKAGIKKGDIVIEMGKIKVDGMQSYMEALSKFKKGDKTKVTVKRGEKEIKKKIVF